MGIFSSSKARTTTTNTNKQEDSSQTLADDAVGASHGGSVAQSGGIVAQGPVTVTDGGAVLELSGVASEAIMASRAANRNSHQTTQQALMSNTALSGMVAADALALAGGLAAGSQATAEGALEVSRETSARAFDLGNNAINEVSGIASEALLAQGRAVDAVTAQSALAIQGNTALAGLVATENAASNRAAFDSAAGIVSGTNDLSKTAIVEAFETVRASQDGVFEMTADASETLAETLTEAQRMTLDFADDSRGEAFDFAEGRSDDAFDIAREALSQNERLTGELFDMVDRHGEEATTRFNQQNEFVGRVTDSALNLTRTETAQTMDTLIRSIAIVAGLWAVSRVFAR